MSMHSRDIDNTPLFIEFGGEILPNYEGVNAPTFPKQSAAAKREAIQADAEFFPRHYELTEQEVARNAGEYVVLKDANGNIDPELTEEWHKAHDGHPTRPTSEVSQDEQIANVRAHERKAYYQRLGE